MVSNVGGSSADSVLVFVQRANAQDATDSTRSADGLRKAIKKDADAARDDVQEARQDVADEQSVLDKHHDDGPNLAERVLPWLKTYQNKTDSLEAKVEGAQARVDRVETRLESEKHEQKAAFESLKTGFESGEEIRKQVDDLLQTSDESKNSISTRIKG